MRAKQVIGTVAMFGLLLFGASEPCFGGSSLKLNGPPLPGEKLDFYNILPDGSAVVYQSGRDYYSTHDVFVVPIGGGTPTLLSGTVTRDHAGGLYYADYYAYGPNGVSPDGSRILFSVLTYGNENREQIYSVPATGGQPVLVIDHATDGSDAKGYTPDGGSLLITSKQHVYSVPLTGGPITQLSSPAVSDDFTLIDPTFSPDGSRLLYWKAKNIVGAYWGELFSDRMDGGSAVQLTDGLNNRTSSPSFTPDGSQVAFITRGGVYITGIDGGTPRLLNRPASDFTSDAYSINISPDGGYVVYKSDEQSDNFNQLYSVPVAGGDPVRLNNPISSTQDSVTFRSYASDSTQVVYEQRHYYGSVFTYDLYSVPLAGGSPINLTSNSAGISISETLVSETDAGSRVIYRTNTANRYSLYSVNLDGTDRQSLSAPVETAAMGASGSLMLSPDGRFVIFGVGANYVSTTKLFAVPVGGGTPVAITPDLSSGTEYIQDRRLTSDGSKVVYQLSSLGDLYVVGFPLAAVGEGEHIAGGVAGGAGFAGGVDFDFSQVDAPGTLRGEFFRTPAAELDGELAAAIDFILSGETIQVWDFGFDGSFTGLVTLTFTYDESLLGAGVAEDMLSIQHQLGDGSFELLPVIGRDLIHNTITVQTEGFSAFVLGVVPEPSSLAVMCMLLGPWVLRRR
ncbi:MAG: PD40 domain-containing protein [Phycisphaeraceae bacterium]|nr:PD40 domain-containing protein [Phycisphaeraceae bacterium]